MNPQAVTPGQTIQPAPTQQSPQGVTSVAPTAAPVAPQLPTGPTPGALPSAPQNPSYNPSAGLDTIANFYQIPRQQAINVAQTQAQGNVAQQGVEAQKYATGLKVQNLQDQLNPSKYNITQDPASPNGVRITNPLGENVDFGTYVNLTGANPAEVLSKSADPQAKQFVQAYQNFEGLMQAMIGASSGDESAKVQLGEYYAANPGLQQMTPDQVSKLFMQRYGQYFGMPQQQAPNNPGVTPTFGSQNSPIAQSPYYQLSTYPQLNQPNPITNSLLGGSNSASGTPDYSAQASQLLGSGQLSTGG